MNNIVCDALLFADKVITEDNGKKGVIGIFDSVAVRSFPGAVPPFHIFVILRNLSEGDHETTFALTREESQQVLLSIPGEIHVRQPRGKIEMAFPVQGVIFHKPGKYELTVHVDGSFVASSPVYVKQFSGKTKE